MGYVYKVTLTHSKSSQSRVFEYLLDFSPTETLKAKAFATAFNTILEGNAIVTDIKYSIYQADKPKLITENYKSKIMYKTTKRGLYNCNIPYLDKTFNKNNLKAFMLEYFDDFLEFDNILVDKIF